MTPLDDKDLTGQPQPGIADASHSSLVLHTYGYFSARESPDGSLVCSEPKSGEGY
jgi:hypothetical protein